MRRDILSIINQKGVAYRGSSLTCFSFSASLSLNLKTEQEASMKEKNLKLLTENLGLKEGERLLVFTDLISNKEPRLAPHHFARREKTRIMAQQVAEVARSITEKVKYHEYKALGSHGVEPPESLWKEAFGERAIARLKEKGLLEPLLRKEDHRVFSQAL
jgi:hypothetical protein